MFLLRYVFVWILVVYFESCPTCTCAAGRHLVSRSLLKKGCLCNENQWFRPRLVLVLHRVMQGTQFQCPRPEKSLAVLHDSNGGDFPQSLAVLSSLQNMWNIIDHLSVRHARFCVRQYCLKRICFIQTPLQPFKQPAIWRDPFLWFRVWWMHWICFQRVWRLDEVVPKRSTSSSRSTTPKVPCSGRVDGIFISSIQIYPNIIEYQCLVPICQSTLSFGGLGQASPRSSSLTPRGWRWRAFWWGLF